jgi:hypothetical protein
VSLFAGGALISGEVLGRPVFAGLFVPLVAGSVALGLVHLGTRRSNWLAKRGSLSVPLLYMPLGTSVVMAIALQSWLQYRIAATVEVYIVCALVVVLVGVTTVAFRDVTTVTLPGRTQPVRVHVPLDAGPIALR